MANKKNHPGNLERRGDGYRWRVCIGGQRHTETFMTTDKKTATKGDPGRLPTQASNALKRANQNTSPRSPLHKVTFVNTGAIAKLEGSLSSSSILRDGFLFL